MVFHVEKIHHSKSFGKLQEPPQFQKCYGFPCREDSPLQILRQTARTSTVPEVLWFSMSRRFTTPNPSANCKNLHSSRSAMVFHVEKIHHSKSFGKLQEPPQFPSGFSRPRCASKASTGGTNTNTRPSSTLASNVAKLRPGLL